MIITKIGDNYFPILLRIIKEAYNFYYKGNESYFSKKDLATKLCNCGSYYDYVLPIAIEAGYIVNVTLADTSPYYKNYIFNKDKEAEVLAMINIFDSCKKAYVQVKEDNNNGKWKAKSYPVNFVRKFGVKGLRARGI